MPIQDLNQLTPEMQAAVPGAPGVPAPVLPIQSAMPDQQAAPDQGQPQPAGPAAPIGLPPVPTTTSSPTVNAIHDGINQAAAATPVADRGKPGQWSKQILAGLSHAFSNVETGLGDVASAQVPPGNHGLLGGIAAVQQARAERIQNQQKAMDEHDREFALTAKTNADFYHQQILNHRESGDYSDKINNEAIQTGKQAVDAATLNAVDAGLDPSKIIHSNITEQQKLNLLVSKNWDPTVHTVWETASQPVIDPATGKQREDADGSKQFQKMYTIIDTPDKIVLNADSAATLNKYLHTDFKEGQELPGALGLAQFQLAANAHALQSNRDAQLAKIDESVANAQQKLAMDKAQENLGTEFLQVVSGLPNVSDQMKFVSGQHMIPDPTGKNPNGIVDPRSADYAQKHPNAPNDLIDSYGGKVKYQALVVNEQKEAEQERKDRAAEAQKGQVTPADRFKEDQENARADKKIKGGVDLAPATSAGLTGEDYIKTLPANVQGNVRAVGEGRLVMSPRQLQDAGGQAFSASVQAAYPDFDETKAKVWGKSRNEYMGSGQTAKKVVSYNTALEHMQDLYANSTAAGLYEPGSKAYSDRNVALGYVSNEVGNAVKNGVMSQKEGDEITDSLKGWTPGTARERTAETARLLHDKIEEYQRKFEESAPSSAVKVPILISPKAAGAYDYVQSGGKQQAAPAPVQLPPAAPGTVNIQDSKGGYHNIPQGGLALAQKRDPKLTVIQ